MSADMEHMPTALRIATATAGTDAVRPEWHKHWMVTRITTAYEQGFGHAASLELSNPYAPDSLESLAWEQGREVGRQRQPEPPGDDALRRMNADLCNFALHWKVDGDYLRCANCKRPHIASRADMAFQHQHGCRKDGGEPSYPWRELLDILKPLIDTPAPGANA